jgi:voltage-gated potassium channel Kch
VKRPKPPFYPAVFRHNQIFLSQQVDWPDGTAVLVTPAVSTGCDGRPRGGHAIVVGFGLAGRYVADLLDSLQMSYTIVERNAVTVETQQALGRRVIQGEAADEETLVRAGIAEATILALTIPDEEAVLKSTALARRLQPNIYIIARTNYSSKGMQASQLGADEVIKAEQAVALQFHDRLSRRFAREDAVTPDESAAT